MGPTTTDRDLAERWGRRPYPTEPHWSKVVHGCTCSRTVDENGAHGYDLGVNSACAYHRYAAQHPNDHRSPWNCPTYWDGCNCPDTERWTWDIIAKQRRRRGHRTRPSRGVRRQWNPYA